MPVQARRRATSITAAIAALVLSLAWVVGAGTPAHAAVTMTISGQVVLPDDAEAGNFQGIQVRAQRVDGGSNTVPGGFDYGYTWIGSSDGTYDIALLNPGVYTVQFRMLPYGPSQTVPQFAPEYFSNSYTEAGATSVDVTSANATNVHAVLEWAGSISGTVTLGADVPETDLQGARVYALGGDDYSSALVEVNSDGSYTIPLLPAGDYTVVFSHAGYSGPDGWTYPQYRDEVYDNMYDVADAQAVTVGSHAAVTGVDALLEAVGHFTSSPPPVILHSALNAGSTLGISGGSWAPAPNFSKRWYRNGVAISGATASTYEITPTDRGKDITFKLTATKAGFTTVSRTSAPIHIPLVFTKTVTPTITGFTFVNAKLSAHKGTWTPALTSATYQWRSGGVDIPGATHSTYVVTAADRGHHITVTVTGKKSGYLSVSKTSAGVYIPKPFKVVTPIITGTPKVGYTLTAIRGDWTPSATYSYTWHRNGQTITGATHKTYTLTAKDKGKRITVRVRGSKPGYITTHKTSAVLKISS